MTDNGPYGIIMDSMQDETGDEQISVCLRHTDKDLNISEDIVGLYSTTSTTGADIAWVAQDVLKRMNLDIGRARA